jgi:hypothetical protein
LYGARFWQAAPAEWRADLRHHRRHQPPSCWYETELLVFDLHSNASQNAPYPQAVCDDRNRPFPKHVVYWHNFKVAGTTARQALSYFGLPNYQAHEIFSNTLRALFPQLPVTDPSRRARYQQHVDTIKQQVYDWQQRGTGMGFTFVRSPVQRFLSGLEQVERLGASDWEVSAKALPCFALSNATTKVECIVDALAQTRVFFNVHLYPQAYLFDAWTQHGELDLAVHVLDLKDMDALMKRFKGRKVLRVRESDANNTKLGLKDHDLDHSLLVKICQLYRMDLLMLQLMNMPDPLCAKAMAVSSS